MSTSDTQRAIKVRVKSFADLARMAASSIALGQATYIIRYVEGSNTIYGIMAVFRDYYKLYGIPLFYYYVDSEGKIPEDKNYVLIKTDASGELIEFSRGSKAGYIVIPIINLYEPPDFIK
ncbi:MAG: cren protein [Desulfurococcales archaeon]|nr:cren protein [Desulfurococcales archaeon]